MSEFKFSDWLKQQGFRQTNHLPDQSRWEFKKGLVEIAVYRAGSQLFFSYHHPQPDRISPPVLGLRIPKEEIEAGMIMKYLR